MTGAVILLVAVVAAVAIAVWHRATNGRFGARLGVAEVPADQPVLPLVDEATWSALGARPGERATLLQFSSAFCAPCRATRVTLGEVARLVPGVAHVEVDAEQHLDLVRRVGVLKTPTTLVLDEHGREATRAAGAPSRDQVLTALSHLSDTRSV